MEKRKTLKNGAKSRKKVDMEKVYRELDSGRSVKSVAAEWGVSLSTLYRRHHEYQAEAERAFKESEFPPLPKEIREELSELLEEKIQA